MADMTPSQKIPVEALLFDLGGVIIDIDFGRAYARWAEHAGCDVSEMAHVVVTGEAYDRYERNEIPLADYLAHLRGQMAADLTDDQLLDGWNNIYVRDAPDIEALLERARARVPLYAFTNTNAAHEAVWSTRFAHLMEHFETVFVSSTIGMRKPELEAFAHVVEQIGAPASRILFFDDLAANIEGAKAAGLQTAHVTSWTTVAETLAGLWPEP
jgi:putative hydrolase of the HAD superfamily